MAKNEHVTVVCPKCGKKTMRKSGQANGHDKRPKWACFGGKTARGNYCYSTVDPTKPYRDQNKRTKRAAEVRKPVQNPIRREHIIVTSAQNQTDVHEGFLTALETLREELNADLRAILLRYHNPTSHWGDKARDADVWDPKIMPYAFETRRKINDNLVIMGDIKTQPTAVDPLTGMESLSMGESAIFGHPKHRMKTVATPQNRFPKILTTTGSVTVPNYVPATAGKKGEFHHVLGAVVVEIEGRKKFHLHHINAQKDGTFIYRNKVYKPDGTTELAPPYQALVMGDAHYRFADPQVVEATFGNGGLVDQLGTDTLVWHDLLDCYFGTPHHDKNPFIKIAKRRENYDVGFDEVFETVRWLEYLGAGKQNIIVPSNHDNMLARWVMNNDWRLDPTNAEFYLETALHMAESARLEANGAAYDDPFAYWVRQMKSSDSDVRCLRSNESFTIGGIELSYHGHVGPSGTRGNINNLSEIGVKLITGHGHSPAIQRGHWRTGTMTYLSAEYTQGPSNWLNAHVSIDAFGKRHMHICIEGKFYKD